MKTRFYGRLKELLGEEVDLDLPAGTEAVIDLRQLLADIYPAAAEDLLVRSRACIEDSIVGDGHPLGSAETIEFFPPLSGG